jgi:hypothetical protein
VKGSGPPAAVVDDTPPTALVGVAETVPPTELLVVSLAVVVVAPLVVVAPEVVVVPPVVVADASWPTLTPASTIKATAMSQADVRLRIFLTCLAIDPYLLVSATTF